MKQLLRNLTLVLVFLNAINANAQKHSARAWKFASAGGFTGFGHAINTDTRYEPIFFSGDFSWSFTKGPKKRDFVAWYFEPQFNIVLTDRPVDIEFGANLGIRNYIRVNDGLFFYQMLGSGPHYISAVVKRQANG